MIDYKNRKAFHMEFLSYDHTPKNSKEKERVLEAGGRIDYYRNQHGQKLGPLRVWLKNQNYPGLTVTRSLGDVTSKKIGCISIPEIIVRKLKGYDVE